MPSDNTWLGGEDWLYILENSEFDEVAEELSSLRPPPCFDQDASSIICKQLQRQGPRLRKLEAGRVVQLGQKRLHGRTFHFLRASKWASRDEV